METKDTINGEQLYLALSYLIWWQTEVQTYDLSPRKLHELHLILKGRSYRTNHEVLGILEMKPGTIGTMIAGTGNGRFSWRDVISPDSFLLESPLVLLTLALASARDRKATSYNVRAIARLVDPEGFTVPTYEPSRQEEMVCQRHDHLITYLTAFASETFTEQAVSA